MLRITCRSVVAPILSFISLISLNFLFSVQTYGDGGTQVVPFITGTGGAGNGRIYFGGDGTYRQVEEEITKLAMKALHEAGITQQEDIKYVLAATQEIHSSFLDYAQLVLTGKMFEMNTTGIQGEATPVMDFMQAIAELKAKKAFFESTLVKLASINKGVLPSNYSVLATSEGRQQQVPSPGMINLEPTLSIYRNLVKDEVDSQLTTYTSIKVEVYGQILTHNQYKDLLNPDFSLVPTLNFNKIAELTESMRGLREQSRNMGMKERRDFSNLVRDDFNGFVEKFGEDYKYILRSGTENNSLIDRFKNMLNKFLSGSDESRTKLGKGETPSVPGVNISTDINARNQAFKRIADVFYLRSYLRLSEGIRICAPQPKEISPSNLGAFKSLQEIQQLRPEVACTKTELESALQSTRLAIAYSGAKAEKIFGQGEFMEAGLLNKLGSMVTFGAGNRPYAETIHMLFQLVYADIQEELIMATPGSGLRELRLLYGARYQYSEEQKKYYSSVKCSIDYDSEVCGEIGAFDETPGVGMPNDFRAVFLDLRQALAAAKAKIEQANRIYATIQAAQKGGAAQKNSRDRAKEL